MAVSKQRRGPGRPAGRGSPAVRRALLSAARALCIEVGLDSASSKAIAERAGVNPAMINYYFGSKEGLCDAMMRDAIAPLLERLDELANASEAMTLERFMRGYMKAVAANRWLPRLIVREVLPANGRFRSLFLGELAQRAVELLPGLVSRERRGGRVRADVELELAMLSMISLAVFPFLAAPVIEPALAIDLEDTAYVDRLVDHSVNVLRRGISP